MAFHVDKYEELKIKIKEDLQVIRTEFDIEIKLKETVIQDLESKLIYALTKIEDLEVALNEEKSKTTALCLEVEELNKGCSKIETRVDHQEDQSRRSNLRFIGIPIF